MSKKEMQKSLQWTVQKITATTLTLLKWLSCGVVVAWLALGYLTLPLMFFAAIEKLSKFDGGVSDSGEGRWTVHAAVDLGVPAPVISSALYERFGSRRLGKFANKILNGMRAMFGGHDVR